MKFTIITATFNRADTLAEAIASLQGQTHADYEHLVQDGGSTDGTLAVVERMADARTRLASGRDGGIYDALNRAMARATGDVIGLLHSDDRFAHPEVLARVAGRFAAHDVDAVYGDLDYVAADGRRVVRHWRSGDFSAARLGRGWMPPHPALFLRREVVERLGGYDTRYRIAADYEAILRWFGKGAITSAYLPEVLVKMRVGGESNRSLGRILRKSREDLQALRETGIGGPAALVWKNLGKLGQFVQRG